MKTSVLCLFLIISIISIYADDKEVEKHKVEEETKEKRDDKELTHKVEDETKEKRDDKEKRAEKTILGKKHVEADESKSETSGADEREKRITGKKPTEKKPVEEVSDETR